jgi:hypothetical protein
MSRSRVPVSRPTPEELRQGNTAADRRTVAASDPSEVSYFAKKHGLTSDQVLDLIKQHGNDRKTLEEAVAKLNA